MTETTLPVRSQFPEGTRGATEAPTEAPARKLAIVCSKGTLDMAYPGLILANAARMEGIDAMLFFTFWGLDIITTDRLDDLQVATVGNPSMHIPTMLGGLPGLQKLATSRMIKGMQEADIPTVREMLEILDAAGAELYACQMAMDMYKRKKEDLIPEVKGVISAMDFLDKAEGAQIIFV